MTKQYNGSDEALGGIVELGVVGTLAGSASSLPSAMVTVVTLASGPVAVSLTGVAATAAAAYVGFSFGKRVVKGINHSLNDGPEPGYEGG